MVLNLTSIKELAKKRQQYFKKLGYEIKLSDVYESLSWENAFRDWNTFSAFLKAIEGDTKSISITDFFESIWKVKDGLYNTEIRNSLESFNLTKEKITDFTRSFQHFIFPIIQVLDAKKNSDSVDSVDLVAPKKRTATICTDLYFMDVKLFIKHLRRKKDLGIVCWSCGADSHLTSFNVNKDLQSLGHKKQQNDVLNLCLQCSADYMNCYNQATNKGDLEEYWFIYEGKLVSGKS